MRGWLIICLYLGLVGCFGGGGQVPQDHFYHLADVPAGVPKVSTPFDSVTVHSFRSDTLHHERSILYSLDAKPLMLNTYYYHLWSDTPGKMLQQYMIAYLRAAGFARDVVRYGEREKHDGEVSGYIQRFERIIGNGRPRVVVWLELTYRSRLASTPLLLTRVYKVEKTADDDSMESSVAAFSQAMSSICAHFIRDIETASRERSS